MARRATSLTKGRPTPPKAAPADNAEQAVGKAPRRGNKKLREAPPADMSVTDAFFPGGEEPVASAAGSGSNAPAKTRRMRKPRSIERAAEPLTPDDEGAEEATAPTTAVHAEEGDLSDSAAAPAAASASMISADVKASSPAARWNADAGTASFDWPAIEAVAAVDGPNQTMAKLLIAARAEGANSRWPF